MTDQLHERQAAGLNALELATTLLRRVRVSHSDAGIWDAADIQWWWRRPRQSDQLLQSFWLDTDGPIAGVLLTQWDERWQLDPIVLPGVAEQLLEVAFERGMNLVRSM